MGRIKQARSGLKIPIPVGAGANKAAENRRKAYRHWVPRKVQGQQGTSTGTHYKKGKSLQNLRVSPSVRKRQESQRPVTWRQVMDQRGLPK